MVSIVGTGSLSGSEWFRHLNDEARNEPGSWPPRLDDHSATLVESSSTLIPGSGIEEEPGGSTGARSFFDGVHQGGPNALTAQFPVDSDGLEIEITIGACAEKP
jgi:hypothetical protein